MTQPSNKFVLSAAALAVSVLMAACGGGEAGPPPDVVPPTLTITDNVSAATATGPVTFTFSFSEDVGSSFTAEDIVVTGGTAGTLTKVVDTNNYTLVVTPAENSAGTISVSVAAAKFSDLSNNANTTATSATQPYDTVVVVTPPPSGGTIIVSFDEVPPVNLGAFGDAAPSIATAPAGGTGAALKLDRSGSSNFGGTFFTLPQAVPFASNRKTVTARVYATRAAAKVFLKVEAAGGVFTEVMATTGAANTWQTVTWVLDSVNPANSYTTMVFSADTDVASLGAQTYWIDEVKLADAPVVTPPPTGTGTVVADFDTVVPGVRDTADTGGFASITTSPPAGGGSGSALAVLRNGVTNYALSVLDATVPFTATRKTLSARVYSPTAGIPMKMKLEGAGGAVLNDLDANETVVVGWQTLTWTFSPDLTKTYNAIVLLPNIGAIDAPPGKTYYFDDITLLPEAVTPPPTTSDTVVADFDTVVPGVRDTADTGGFASITTSPPAGGGSGSALAVLRNGVTNYALSVLDATVPFTATRKTLSARVYSPTAGIPMKMKLEGAGGAVLSDLDANETVVVGWQTLTWTFSPDLTKTYNAIVLLPNIGAIDASPGKTYYFDDIKLLAAASGGDGGTTPPGADMGSGGPQTLRIATGDVKTGDGGNTMFVSGEGLFSVNYVGSAEAAPPNNLAAWPNAKTANFAGITGISGGDIGYFQDDVNLSNSSQKVDEGGWVAGTALAPLGVPNFFRFFVLKGPVSNSAYMGLYVNAPNNGTVDVSGFSKIKVKVWGPGPMFERTNFNPVLEVTLTGPKVAGCTTGSGGSEITQNLTANLKNGAGGFYTLPLSGFTVKGLCGTDSGAANVLAKLARVVVTVPGTSFNYTNPDAGNYPTGVNLGPVGFTNN